MKRSLIPLLLGCVALGLPVSAQETITPKSKASAPPSKTVAPLKPAVPVASETTKAPPRRDGVALQDILVHVYNNHPGLQASRAGLHAAHEMYPQALAGWRPTLTTQASIYTTDVESSNFGRGDGATTKDFSVNLEQPIFSSGRTDAQVDRANALIKASYATYLQNEQDLFYEAALAYMNVIRDRQILDVNQRNEEILTTELKAVNERFDGGDLTLTDVEQTKARLARAQAERIAAHSNLEESYAAFQAVTGFAPSGAFHYPVPSFSFPVNLADMIRIAEEKNQMLREARFQLAAAEEEVDVNVREILPQIKGFASYQKEYDPQPGIIDESEVKTLGVRATLTLYQGGAIRSRIREAKSRAQQRRYEILDTQQDLKASVLESWKTLKMAEQEMLSRNTEIEATRRARDGVKEEARMGERTTLDVLDADQEVIRAESAHINARYVSTMASFSLARSLGIFTPEGIGLGGIAYDPGDHYRRSGDKWLSTDAD